MELDTLNMLVLIIVCIIINVWFGMAISLIYGINNLCDMRESVTK